VRDIAQAYIQLLEHGQPGEAYNVASETVHSMQQILQRLLELACVRVEVRQQSHLTRASEPCTTRASSVKLRKLTGWSPRITLEQSLTDTLSYWRENV
jgi:GDP-4-dehydro-6-deoxy-D-mannose reductase